MKVRAFFALVFAFVCGHAAANVEVFAGVYDDSAYNFRVKNLGNNIDEVRYSQKWVQKPMHLRTPIQAF